MQIEINQKILVKEGRQKISKQGQVIQSKQDITKENSTNKEGENARGHTNKRSQRIKWKERNRKAEQMNNIGKVQRLGEDTKSITYLQSFKGTLKKYRVEKRQAVIF